MNLLKNDVTLNSLPPWSRWGWSHHMNEKRWVGIKLIYPNSAQDVNPSDPGIVSKFGASSHADRISEHVQARTRREPWVGDSIAASFCIGRAACARWTFMPVSTCTDDQNGDVWMSMHWCCQQMRQTHDSGHRMWRKSGLVLWSSGSWGHWGRSSPLCWHLISSPHAATALPTCLQQKGWSELADTSAALLCGGAGCVQMAMVKESP